MKRFLTLVALTFIFTTTINTLSYAQNMKKIDKRALYHYTKQEINEMPLYKIMQINYDYNESYIIPDEMKKEINSKKIEIYKLLIFRKKYENNKIDIGIADEKETGKYIILKSQQEVAKMREEIKKQYSK